MSDAFGATILGVGGLQLSAGEAAFFRRSDPFGFILFARNIDAPGQLRDLCAALRDTVGRDAPILIDQEGGRVQRLRAPHWREWLPALDQVQAAGDAAAEVMRLRSRIIAHELRAVGVDVNCAPLADIAGPGTHEFLRNRCYGEDAAGVARVARAVADGLSEGGVLPVLKHIPGHGRAGADSHLELPMADAGADTLRKSDFAAFRALNDLPLGMTAHLVYPAIDPRPATTSPVIMRLIRDEIGFDGLIMTDDISMKALRGNLDDLSRASRAAGCDVVLHCNGRLDEMRIVADAAGRMGAAAQERAQRALAARKTPTEVDIPGLEARLNTLMNGCAE